VEALEASLSCPSSPEDDTIMMLQRLVLLIEKLPAHSICARHDSRRWLIDIARLTDHFVNGERVQRYA
jgi:hypothetical protein